MMRATLLVTAGEGGLHCPKQVIGIPFLSSWMRTFRDETLLWPISADRELFIRERPGLARAAYPRVQQLMSLLVRLGLNSNELLISRHLPMPLLSLPSKAVEDKGSCYS